MIQSTSDLVCFGKREREKKIEKKNERKKSKKKSEKKRKRKRKKSVRKKREKKKKLDLSRINLVPEFGLESVLRTVQ